MADTPKTVTFDNNPGRNAQTYGIARELDTDVELIHAPSVGVIGTKGDSQCYMGVQRKVEAIHAALRERVGQGEGQMALRLVQPEYTVATSDGMRNGTREMRYSLIGREVTHDSVCEHLSASGLEGTIAVVACDKPPVGTLAALLEHDRPAIMMSDGPIHPVGIQPPRSRSTSSPPSRLPATPTPRSRTASRAKPARATAVAVACSPTTPCRHSSEWSACSHCTWWHRRRMTRADCTSFPNSLSATCTA